MLSISAWIESKEDGEAGTEIEEKKYYTVYIRIYLKLKVEGILFTPTAYICREFLVKPEGETLWNQLEFNLRKRIHREV